jgi:small glutamine-rich tetratricopeptide repeat-containing protein alpha
MSQSIVTDSIFRARNMMGGGANPFGGAGGPGAGAGAGGANGQGGSQQ